MPDLLERVRASRATPARPQNLSFQEYVDYFRFDGVDYPLLRTSTGKLDEEQLAWTADAAYHSSGPVFALVVARLQVFSQARFQWTRFQGGQPSDLFGTPALKVLEKPWRGGTTADLLARMEVDASLAGTGYIRRISRPRQPPRLNRLRPEWVIVVLGSDEDADHPAQAGDVELLGFAYAPPMGPMVVLDASEVALYAPLPDPDRVFLGMSWVTPLIRDVQADGAMTEHKRMFMVNSATPNLVIKFDARIGQEAVEKFKAIFEAGHTGVWNAYKTLYLGGGADPITVGKDFRQLEFSTTQGKGESRLAAAAGVPPSWVGFSEGLQGSALNAGNFNCVPLEAEALTLDGWKHQHELHVGDMVLGYDRNAEVTRWTPITAITPVAEADVVRFGNAHWSTHCTSNHAWLGRWARAQSPYPAWAAGQTPVNWGRMETTRFREGFQLLTTAPAMTEHAIDVRPAEAAVIAWLLTDGSVERSHVTGRTSQAGGTKVGMRGRIFQKHYRAEVRTALALAEAPFSEYPWGQREGLYAYSLPAAWLRNLWSRARLDELTLQQFVLRLGPEAREAFLSAGMLAEGHATWRHGSRSGRRLGDFGDWYGWTFAQNDGAVFEAFAIAAQLSGYSVRLRDQILPQRNFRCAKPRLDAKHLRVEPAGRTPVWCIETGLGSWTMRQGGIITLTGNSARRRFADGTMHHLWSNAAASLEVLVPDPVNANGASLWFDTSAVPFMREDASDQAKIQAEEAQTIALLVKDGFEPPSVIDAVRNRDWTRLRHSGLWSVQLQPPLTAQPAPANGQGNGKLAAAATALGALPPI